MELKQKSKPDYQEGEDWHVVDGTGELKTPSAVLTWLKSKSQKSVGGEQDE